MANKDKKDRVRYIYEIVRILAEAKHHLSIKTIHRKLEDTFEVEINPRTVKQYVLDIQKSFDYGLDVKRGPEGGYMLSEDWKQSISQLASLQLNKNERNALNDAFEIALKSPTFFYSDQLEEAKRKLYMKADLKDEDNEYYVGKRIRARSLETIVYDFKDASISKEYVLISFKHNYYNYPTKLDEYKPLYIIHDSDETFIIIKDHDGNIYHQNLLNVKALKRTSKHFVDSFIKPVGEYINDFTIKVKGEHTLKFKIKNERGRMIFDLWNYEFEDKSQSNSEEKHIVFYERYILSEFLLRMNNHIEITYISEEDKNDWNNRVDRIKKIK